ncbi:MAG: deoxyribose-phosphate aldolase, partial [Akkermansiaceae bacterium]
MKTSSKAASAQYDYNQSPTVDQVGIAERAARFTTRSIKTETKRAGLDMVLNMIDLTTLEGADTPNKVRQLCYKAEHLHDSIPKLPTTAAVCVYAPFVSTAREALGDDSPVKIASVATYFPSGHALLKTKL